MGDTQRRTAVAAPLPPQLSTDPPRGFVGRESELASVRRAIDAVVARTGPALVLVAGDPGAGKTTLVARAAREAVAAGCTVAYGRAEGGIEAAFGAWRHALRARWPKGQREREELFDTVLDRLAEASARQPLLLVLDDLQWADQATLLLLRHVVNTQPSPALAVVLVYRSTESQPATPLGELLAHLAREPDVVRVALRGLEESDVAALAGDGSVARRVWTDTKGNAFFVTALLDELEAGSASSTLREVIGHRVARLGTAAAPILRAASVVGEVFDTTLLAAVSGHDEPAVLDVLEAATADGLVTEVPDGGFTFVHALVADSLASELSGPRRRALHRATANALLATDADPGLVARHLAAADPDDPTGRTAAADAAIGAGVAAIAEFAYEDAVRLLTDAVDMIERWRLDDERRCAALIALSRAQRMAGIADAAVPTAVAAIDLATQLERWDDVTAALLHFPRTAAAVPDPALVATLERAATVAPPTSTVQALALAALSWVVHFTPDQARARGLAEEAVALADTIGDRRARAYTRSLLLVALAGDPGPEQYLELLQTVEELTDADDDYSSHARLRRVYALMRMGDVDKVNREIHRAERLVATRRRPHLRWWVLTLKAMLAILQGRLREGETLKDEAWSTENSFGAHASIAAMMAQTALIQYFRGSLGDYAPALADYAQQFPIPALKSSLAAALAFAGRTTEAREILVELAKDDFAVMPRDDSWTTACFMLGEVVRLLQADAEAAALHSALAPYAGEYVVISSAVFACFGSVDRTLGQVAAVCGWHERAGAHLGVAVRMEARIGAGPFLALARAEQAALGVPGAAEEARAIATELGIDLVLQRLDELEPGCHSDGAALRLEGGVWTVTYAGHSAQLKDLRGLHYLRELLARPGREVAAVELQGGSADTGAPMLDEVAKAAYRRRLDEIEAQLEEAEAFGDGERAARAEEQRQALAEELARAVGIGGRDRRMGSAAERARLNVSRAINAAVGRIGEVHPDLGRHLELAVRTGTYCAYEPDPRLAISWSV